MKIFGTIIELGLFRIYNPFKLPNDVFAEEITKGIQYYFDKPSPIRSLTAEIQARLINPLQTLTKQQLGDMPLTVVTTPFVATSRFEGELPTETDKKLAKTHEKLQYKTLLSSTNSKMEIIDDATHMSLIFDKTHSLQVVPHIIDIVDRVIGTN